MLRTYFREHYDGIIAGETLPYDGTGHDMVHDEHDGLDNTPYGLNDRLSYIRLDQASLCKSLSSATQMPVRRRECYAARCRHACAQVFDSSFYLCNRSLMGYCCHQSDVCAMMSSI